MKIKKHILSPEFIGFRFSEIKISNNYLCSGFNLLEEYIGNGPVQYIMKILDFNENRDTKFCLGFRCPEKIYTVPVKNYCNPCKKQMIFEEYIFCKKCKLLKNNCFHCQDCNYIFCICNICRYCEKKYKKCNCSENVYSIFDNIYQ